MQRVAVCFVACSVLTLLMAGGVGAQETADRFSCVEGRTLPVSGRGPGRLRPGPQRSSRTRRTSGTYLFRRTGSSVRGLATQI